ncbi:Rrf2 family transcriptional regulator [Candidatus Desantisbacteria bacterium]|nr:Rrf2 family transcriptional regulator [Candidatus Desantisbacteria bacterium]
MWLSTKGRYAVRMMIELGLHEKGEVVSVREISVNQDISPQYVEQLMVKLRKVGLVKSIRGPAGGYRLAKEASSITAGDIIRTLEDYIDPVFCIDPKISKKECTRASGCAARLLWKRIGEATAEILDSTTIEDLVRMDRELLNTDKK